MVYRNVTFTAVMAGLLVAGFCNDARATNFTNSDFVTYNQTDWGDTTDMNPAAMLLNANYDTVYASTMGLFEVGIPGPSGFSMLFTGAGELLDYFPDFGSVGPLDGDLVNPTSSSSGQFGGEVAALKLNIDFSDAGLLRGNLNVRFGDLVLQNFGRTKSGPSGLNGLTVRQFSAFVNTALGGGSFSQYGSYTIANLFSIVLDINDSFRDGAVQAFASNNLAVAQVPLVMQTASHSGNSITLTWSTTPASMYQVQFITDLTQTNWTNVGDPIRATNFTCTASITTTNSQGFYRIDLLP